MVVNAELFSTALHPAANDQLHLSLGSHVDCSPFIWEKRRTAGKTAAAAAIIAARVHTCKTIETYVDTGISGITKNVHKSSENGWPCVTAMNYIAVPPVLPYYTGSNPAGQEAKTIPARCTVASGRPEQISPASGNHFVCMSYRIRVGLDAFVTDAGRVGST